MRLSPLSQVRSAITGKNRFPVTIRQIHLIGRRESSDSSRQAWSPTGMPKGPEAAASREMNMEFTYMKPALKMPACEEIVPKKGRPTLLSREEVHFCEVSRGGQG
jgi:hypothetical protein